MNMLRIWRWSEVKEIWQRRFIHNDIAIEVFIKTGKSYFFNCFTEEARKEVIKAIYVQKIDVKVVRIKEIERNAENLKEIWLKGHLSNYEYIQQLNQMASRSFNEMSQYPIFPWVLSNYEDENLALEKEENYRNFDYSIGAQCKEARVEAVQRFNMMRDSDMEPFHFGSHYSTGGVVSYYMIRLEPFSTCAIELQDGQFDVADRLFSSIDIAWKGCLSNSGDYKELIPEFFTLPESFLNVNRYSLGITQSKTQINNVCFPRWAGTVESGESKPLKIAYNFVRLHRKALESQYVSSNLSHWIDLIFGYKQLGQEAELAVNVFYPYTYKEKFFTAFEQAGERDKEGIRQQVVYYGQTPIQLFAGGPHPKQEVGRKMKTVVESGQENGIRYSWDHCFPYTADTPKTVQISVWKSKLFMIREDRSIRIMSPRVSGVATKDGSHGTMEDLHLAGVSPPSKSVPVAESRHFLVSEDSVFSCYYPDSSFKIHNLETGQLLKSVSYHSLPVTCLAYDQHTLLAGSEDSTLSLWSVFQSKTTVSVADEPDFLLYGHRNPVFTCAIDLLMDVSVSSDLGGIVLIHSPCNKSILAVISVLGTPLVAISSLRLIAVSSEGSETVGLYTLVGAKVDTLTVEPGDSIGCMSFTKSGDCLLTGGAKKLAFHDVFAQTPQRIVLVKEESGVICIYFGQEEQYLLIGMRTGVVGKCQRENEVKRRLQISLTG